MLEANLGHGADVNAMGARGTALHFASLHRQVGAIGALIEAGADTEVKDGEGRTLHMVWCTLLPEQGHAHPLASWSERWRTRREGKRAVASGMSQAGSRPGYGGGTLVTSWSGRNSRE